ncbi:PucR family transcriptional regulator [Streptomyces lavendulae subsp. lavendulae]|uniref:helix-turn-helix domain-containing protein n=2 Tax=Streptomyces lavendulae TaxID=1914 RepID=UPI0024A11A76|nr:PucR family transcriptional regulator [Streptomyces lavendulae]GLV81642.1 PucR family transcriptional regulator [Streptomyces lavendulae subsp. lavendulae]
MEAPLTPPVPLTALTADRELGLRLLAGPADADIYGVHASEMADPSPYLLGGELLLTAGAGLAGAGPAPAQYVERLVRAGVGAVGFGVTPVHETVPPALVEACGRYGLPLVEVPPGTPFTAVGRAVWRLMAEARTRELRRVTEAQQSLASAAARPHPVAAVLSRLAASLNGWAALLPPPPPTPPAPHDGTGPGPGGAGDEAGVGPGEGVREALAGLAGRVAAGGVATATDTLGGTHLAAYAVGGGRVLALATPARAPGDHTIASVAAVLLTLLTASRPAGDEAASLTRLLLDGDPAGALSPGPWYAVHARGGGDPRALAAALGTVLLDPRGDGVRLLTDREPAPQPGWRLGVSAPAAPAGLGSAGAQARRALERAEAARTQLARHAEPGLAGLVGEAEARAHAEALLGPLSPALRDTLRGWLAHHGSWDRTAAALGVHRNTVRQRIARAAGLLGADLDDPDTRMELWFALRHAPGPEPTDRP